MIVAINKQHWARVKSIYIEGIKQKMPHLR